MIPLLRQVAHAPKPLWRRRGYGGQAGPPRRVNLDENVSMTRNGNTYYYMADGLRSIRNIAESDEDTANTYDYYAFGDTLGTETQRSPSLNRTRIGRGNRSDDRG